ncbi:enoyl-CoA delta isomerase 2 [Protopterus annectens]|uniref:enoyl-CoA delta isomerase 2 n=1 Tax=Protopterus annectens TaxID=7888 RepID=UPI001CFBCB1D|nr:enoyl-CoA delta isomerase 2 [Protopterus annectens]
MRATQEEFEKAVEQLKLLKQDPGNETKLHIYALFKQATQGPCNVSKPGMLDFVNKAKWDAWNALGSLSKDDARKKYVDLVSSLVQESPSSIKATQAGSTTSYETLLVTKQDKITTICFNRPDKKNAITTQMYSEIMQALEEAAQDDSVITVMTGSGDYYSSGNDLSNFTKIPPEGVKKAAEESGELLETTVEKFLSFPRPMEYVSTTGQSTTLVELQDVLHATEQATFHTPFSHLGQSPEGCSTYLFPQIMGPAKANEVLLFNRKLTAAEACNLGLVTEVFPDSSFQKEVWVRLRSFAKLPKNSLMYSKQLIRGVQKEKLHAVNIQECERLKERWLSEDCMNAIMNFFQKSKL